MSVCWRMSVAMQFLRQHTKKNPNLHMNFFSVQLRGSCLIIYSSQQPFSVRIKLKIYFQKRMVLLW